MRFYDGLLGHDPDIFYNSTGHRCKELSELNFRNYILFAGDNIGLGLDKPIEETYPYLVAKSLGVDYYNLSIFNGGLDAIKLNLIAWFSTFKEKPKAVIISCEFINSLLCSLDGQTFFAGHLEDENIIELMNAGNTTGFFNARNEMANKHLNKVITSPIFQIKLPEKEVIFRENILDIDYQGDIYDYVKLADTVIPFVKQTFTKVRP